MLCTTASLWQVAPQVFISTLPVVSAATLTVSSLTVCAATLVLTLLLEILCALQLMSRLGCVLESLWKGCWTQHDLW